jgi:hypothetical protein
MFIQEPRLRLGKLPISSAKILLQQYRHKADMQGLDGGCQFKEVKRTSRLGVQVVRINADLLHFHSIPSALESSIGGVDLIGSKVAENASATNTTMTEGRFIAVILFLIDEH